MLKVEVKNWLAKEKDIPNIVEGEKESETEKAILLNIRGKNKKVWLPKSQINISKKFKFKPKAKIGMDARKLKDGTIKKKGVAIKSPYEQKELCKKVKNKFGGKWKAKKQFWSFPLEIEVVDYAKEVWERAGKELIMSDLLEEWYYKRENERSRILALRDLEDVPPEKLNNCLADTLYDFQRVGTHFLSNKSGAILGDDMGLGKTIQTLATVDELKADQVLIVCPASLRLNWAEEIEKWLPNYSYTVLSGSKKKRIDALDNNSTFYITNYASLRQKSRKKKNGQWVKIENPLFKKIRNKDFEIMILDEAHKIKNKGSQQTKAVYKLATGVNRVYELTGTPIMNKPDDLWSLLHVLDKKRFSSYWRFVNRYCEVWDNGFGKEIGKAKNPKEFREMLKPYFLRRLKEDVIEDMPELTIQKRHVKLEGKQKKIYKQMEDRMVAEVTESEEITASIVISKIMRLKQIAVSPSLISEEKKDFKSAKIDMLFDIIDESGEQKIVVFTQYQGAAELVAKELKEKGIGYGILHGGIDTDTRQENVNKFQNDRDCKVFVATIKAGGVGINLTAGSIAVFLDKDWTPANNSQAVDRLHRIGQKRNVTVIELIAKDTIESYIEELLEEKQETFDNLIEGKISGKEILLNLKGGG
ncbi:MAG: DEAD/DEAH box helicase [bacterium]